MNYLNELPEKFIERMKSLENFNFDEFIESYNHEPKRGLRVNTLKCSVDEFKDVACVKLENLPFCNEGFYIDSTLTGKHPLHHAGIIYFQEPSAMSAVTALDVKEGMNVLDLCAAPGGKSTQIATKLKGTGFLLSNEIIPSRSTILLSNMERCGVRNFAITNEDSKKISDKFEGFFDRVLVDAPCSGEGMFKREPAALTEWSVENTKACSTRQLEILDNASKTLKENGILVYSTCTFAPVEDEFVIKEFLKNHENFSLETIDKEFGSSAHPEWVGGDDTLKLARRIFPKDGGEGHFVSKLRKSGTTYKNISDFRITEPDKSESKLFEDFFTSQFDENIYGSLHKKQDRIFIIPFNAPDLTGLNIVRCGVFAGRIKGKRFEPDHSLYLAADKDKTLNSADFAIDSNEIKNFLHGEQINAPENSKKGYLSVKAGGFIIGFGKMSDGVIKNHYPKGLRNL